MKKFEDLHIQEPLKQWLKDKHFKEMTAIQEEMIPLIIQGKEMIGLSETGSGKTHAFLVPIFEKIDVSLDQVQAVVTAPTRELAYQIYEMAKEVENYLPKIRISAVVGGKERVRDSKKFQHQQPHVVIGTPGRLKDLFLEYVTNIVSENKELDDKAKIIESFNQKSKEFYGKNAILATDKASLYPSKRKSDAKVFFSEAVTNAIFLCPFSINVCTASWVATL